MRLWEKSLHDEISDTRGIVDIETGNREILWGGSVRDQSQNGGILRVLKRRCQRRPVKFKFWIPLGLKAFDQNQIKSFLIKITKLLIKARL